MLYMRLGKGGVEWSGVEWSGMVSVCVRLMFFVSLFLAFALKLVGER